MTFFTRLRELFGCFSVAISPSPLVSLILTLFQNANLTELERKNLSRLRDENFNPYFCLEDVSHYLTAPATVCAKDYDNHPRGEAFCPSREDCVEKAIAKLSHKDKTRIKALVKDRDIREPSQLKRRYPFEPPGEDSDTSVSTFESWAPAAELLRSDQNLVLHQPFIFLSHLTTRATSLHKPHLPRWLKRSGHLVY